MQIQTPIVSKLEGKEFIIPEDLYIPPDALHIFLETFEGPLDLLLYLIKKQNIDILNIPVAQITEQYLHYVDLMQGMRFELAAEYLLMAAMLAEIKSRMMLPRRTEIEEEEADPRTELMQRLQEYEQFKKAAENLDALPQEGKNVFRIKVDSPKLVQDRPLQPIPMDDLLSALKDILARAALRADHTIQMESISVRARMSDILSRLQQCESLEFHLLFKLEEGRIGVVVSFIALLELLKQGLVDIIQEQIFKPITIMANTPASV